MSISKDTVIVEVVIGLRRIERRIERSIERPGLLAKKTFPTLHSYVIPGPLCIHKTSWKFVVLLVKHPGVMSFKCRRSVGKALYQKMRTPKLYVILKKIVSRVTYPQTERKMISLFNVYDRLKSSLFSIFAS